MQNLDRITRDPGVMGGKPCLRGMRVTAGTIVGLIAAGRSKAEILEAYPYLEEEDIRQALLYAAWRVEELEVPLPLDTPHPIAANRSRPLGVDGEKFVPPMTSTRLCVSRCRVDSSATRARRK